MKKIVSVLSAVALSFSLVSYAGAEESQSQSLQGGNVKKDTAGTYATNDGYVVVSNESTTGTGYTGKFSVENMPVLKNSGLKPSAYKLNVKVPYDVTKHQDKKLDLKSITPELNKVNDVKNFYTQNFVTNKTEVVSAKLLYAGTKANVWVPNGVLTTAEATKIGQEFDNKIHPVIANNFGVPSDVDKNGKVNILTYDIKDGFNGSGGYIAGYFYGGDLFNEPNSNKSEIFYVDTYPSMGTGGPKNVAESYSTLAHEYEHMVNFNQNVFKETPAKDMDVWLDEALAMAAEQIYTGKVLTDRIQYYNASYSIANGHSLVRWSEWGDLLSNYSLSYLFGQYLRVQSKQGNKIFKEIIQHPNENHVAVEKLVQKHVNSKMTFGKFMTSFRTALLFKQSTGLNGFGGESAFNAIKTPLYTGSSMYLAGGGALVKAVNTDTFKVPADKDKNITYSLFTNNVVNPTVNAVGDSDVKVTGKASLNATVYVKAGTKVVGSGQTSSSKAFSVTIPKQKPGTTLKVYAKNNLNGKTSGEVAVVVKDKTAPTVTLKASTTSPTNKNITITATATDSSGIKSLKLPDGKVVNAASATYMVSKNGTYTFEAIDKVGLKTVKSIKISNIDRTAPAKPTVNLVLSQDKAVKGKTEPNATVYVKIGTKVVGSAKADAKGNYSVTIPAQKTGTKIAVYAKDVAGNTGSSKTVTVINTDGINFKTTRVTDMKKFNGGTEYLTYINGKGYSQYFYESASGNYQFIPSSWLTAAGLTVEVRNINGKKLLNINNPYKPATSSVVKQSVATMPYASAKVTVTNVTDMNKYDAGKGKYLTYVNDKPYSQYFYETVNGNYQFVPSSWLTAAGLTVQVKVVNGVKKVYISNPYKK